MRQQLSVLTVLVGLTYSVGACAPSLRELTVRIPAYEISYVPSDGDSMAGPYRELSGRLENWGVTIVHSDEIPGFGLSDRKNYVIALKADMTINGQFEVLAHESAHLFMPPTLQDWAQTEVFAEAVALEVANYYGHPYRATAAQYLAGYKQGLFILELLKVDIDFATQVLTGQVVFEGWWQ